jgi:hypothetical protein
MQARPGAQKWAGLVFLVGLVMGVGLLVTPFSDGPYRCSPVVAGSEGRQTVHPDDTPPDLDDPSRTVDDIRAELDRRTDVCRDAGAARTITALVVIVGGLILGIGVALILGPSRDRPVEPRSGGAGLGSREVGDAVPVPREPEPV